MVRSRGNSVIDGLAMVAYSSAPLGARAIIDNSAVRVIVYGVAGIAVIAVSAWLRMSRLDLVVFNTDDAGVLRLAEDWVRLGRMPLVGIHSSVGVPLAPWFVYLVAPAVVMSRDPSVASGLIGLINVAGVAGVVATGWRFLSPIGGLASGLMLATHPWAVFYSRRLWPNDALSPCAVLLCFALEQGVIARRTGWAVAALPILAIGVQIHFSFAVLAPLVVAPLVILAITHQWRALLASVALALLTAVPYLIHLLNTDWVDLQVVRALATKPAEFSADGPAYVMSWATTWDTWYLAWVHLDRLLPGRVAAVAANLQTGLVALGAGVTLLVALGVGSSSAIGRVRSTGLLLWLLLPAALTIRHTLPIGDQYFPFVAPAAALLVGVGVHWLALRAGTAARAVLGLALASLILVAAIHVVMVVHLLDYVTVQYNDTYGLPLAASEVVAADLGSFGTDAQVAAVEYAGPEGGAMAYLVRPFFPGVELSGVGQVGLGARSSTDRASGAIPVLGSIQHPELRYADGVRIAAAVTSDRWTPGKRIRFAVVWTAADAALPADRGVTWEVAAYDSDGVRLAEQLGMSHRSAEFGPAETVLSVFSLETESGAPTVPLRIGLRRVDVSAEVTPDEWRSTAIEPTT